MFEEVECGKGDEDFRIFQMQYKICSEYIHIATSKLYTQEAALISQSNSFLNSFSEQLLQKNSFDLDNSSTRDSTLTDFDSSFSFQRKSRISRKTILGAKSSKEIDHSLSQSIKEVEKQCSRKTANAIQMLADQYKKLKAKIAEIEQQEKHSKLKQQNYESTSQNNLLLNHKIKDLENTHSQLTSEIMLLKAKNKEFQKENSERQLQSNHQKISKILMNAEMVQKSARSETFIEFIGEKENLINKRYQAILTIEQEIQKNLLGRFENQCEKCCGLLRKIKPSLLLYRSYLEREGQELDRLVDSYKENVNLQ